MTPSITTHAGLPVAYGVFLAILSLVLSISVLFSLRGYLGLTRQGAVSLGFGTPAPGCLRSPPPDLIEQSRGAYGRHPETRPSSVSFLARGFCVLFSIIYIVKLYRTWMGQPATEPERLAGLPGLRAWLQPRNLLLVLFVAITAAVGFDLPFAGILLLALALLLAYPLTNTALQTAPAGSVPVRPEPAENLTPEREKVLAMLDAGKITAEECAELLAALAKTNQPGLAVAAKVAVNRFVLAGAALILVSFFLPWFAVNPSQELNRLSNQFQSTIGEMMPGMPSPMANATTGIFGSLKTGTIYMSGGEIPHGLGWAILILGVAAAALPFVGTRLEPAHQRHFCLTTLAVGSFLILYLLTQDLRHIHVGLILAAAGYSLEFLGLLRVEAPMAHSAAGVAPSHI